METTTKPLPFHPPSTTNPPHLPGVVVPAGEYKLGMISLRDNIELHLEHEAVLSSILKPVPQEGRSAIATFHSLRCLIGG